MAGNNGMQPEEPDTSINPYDALNLEDTATEAEIRSAYKKLALKNHPDKVAPEERDTAHKEFQKIAFAYAVLSDPRRRKRYDTTGSTAESALDDEDFDWSDFFRARYSEITIEKIADFEREYKNSEEEVRDLLKAYEKHKGRMNAIYEDVMLSNPLKDEDRFSEIINRAISKGTVVGYDAFLQESAVSKKRRIDKARREAEEAEEYEQELAAKKKSGKRTSGGDLEVEGSASSDEDSDEDVKKPSKPRSKSRSKPRADKKPGRSGGLGDLAAMIQQRQQSRASTFLDDLEAKYAPKSSKGKKRQTMEEPPEEAFQRNAAPKRSKKSKQ